MARGFNAQTRGSNLSHTGLEILFDVEALLEILGAGQALGQAPSQKDYIDAVVDIAYEKADEKFNSWAAAYGATGAISHMYEWGTVGINPARSNRRMNPADPAARLWHNVTTGAGFDRLLTFVYRPSITTVPKPTAKDTGMSPEVIAKMRDHVFRWKAQVLEEGQTVNIAPNKAKFLLIPAYANNRAKMRPHDRKRGYMLARNNITIQHDSYEGTFEAFWWKFWEGPGTDVVQDSVNDMIVEDYLPEIYKSRRRGRMVPVGSMNIKTKVAANAKKTQKKVDTKARARKIK